MKDNGDCSALNTGARGIAASVTQKGTKACDVERAASGKLTIAHLVVRVHLVSVSSVEHLCLCNIRAHSWQIGSWTPKELSSGSPGALKNGAGASPSL